MMLTLRCVNRTRAFLSPLPIYVSTQQDTFVFFFFSTTSTSSYEPSYPFFPSAVRTPALQGVAGELQAKEVVLHFREWFMSGRNLLFDQIFEILAAQDDDQDLSGRSADLALSRLGLRLSETLVLEVLKYGKDVLSCLKFFDWAGRQKGFYHTRATFYAIFKILSRAKLMSVMLDFLDSYMKCVPRGVHKVRFYNTLVMGYAVAGKLEVALQLFGRMRFQGIDLDGFAYHVLLNALVEEESFFDVVEMVAKQIKLRGYESEVTHSILVKSFSKQKNLDEAETYVHGLLKSGVRLSGYVVGVLIDSLCENKQFEKAAKLIEKIGESGSVPMEHVYGVWIRDLVRVGKLDGALEFLQRKKSLEGYIPDMFRYNTLICRLLRENRLQDVCDLLIEMKEHDITPDEVTMNSVLCFFCKAGMVEVALELYSSRSEFGLSPSTMAYNYLINTLCGDGSVDEAYGVLRSSINEGYFPGRKTFSILADALCREGKLDKMRELVFVALGRNFMPSASTFDKFISALCKTRRVEDGYLVHSKLSPFNKVASRSTYFNLIRGFNKANRGDIAARLLIEMQEKGHIPTRLLFRAVIRCLCDMENPEKQFWRLLEMQLSRFEPNSQVYNFFIDGAGHARKPELALQVYEMMRTSGISPGLSSEVLLLRSYLKSEKISDAINFFEDLSRRRKIGRKLCNAMLVGLCKANKPDTALAIFTEMREKGIKPSVECYEELIKLMCLHQRYEMVVYLIDDMSKVGRSISSFIGNVLLFDSLKTRKLYNAWVCSRDSRNNSNYNTNNISNSELSELIGVFSDYIRENRDIEDLEQVIEQCFPLDIFTYNMLLRELCNGHMDDACKVFNRLCQKGYEPNRWTYDTLVHGFYRHGRTEEAKRWLEEMFRRGFDPTHGT